MLEYLLLFQVEFRDLVYVWYPDITISVTPGPNKFAQVITLLTCIRDVLCSNL
jgi:hypothetical protein